jgi:NitT/TauT family transport system substrate-binding protein
MRTPHPDGWTRRRFLGGLTLAGTAGLLGLTLRPVAAEPPPEVQKIRLVHAPAICLAPQYLAEELLHLEGFSDVTYVDNPTPPLIHSLATGQADFTQDGAPGLLPALDAGQPIVGLSGLHVGCYELFGNDRVRAIRDLKGKNIAVGGFGGADHIGLRQRFVHYSHTAHPTAIMGTGVFTKPLAPFLV